MKPRCAASTGDVKGTVLETPEITRNGCATIKPNPAAALLAGDIRLAGSLLEYQSTNITP